MLFVVEKLAQMFIYQIPSKQFMDPLIAYIHKEKYRGFSDALVAEKMKAAGYDSDEITAAFKEFYAREHYHKFIDRIVEEETKHKWIFLVLSLFAVIIVTAILVISVEYVDWHDLFSSFSTSSQEMQATLSSPQTEADCAAFGHRPKEQCILKVAALQDDVSFCVNMTSKVMQYECKNSVWKTNYCNFLILTNQSTATCTSS